MAGAQFDQRGGQNGAFEVQVQLGLGQAADEGFDLGHSFKFTGLGESAAFSGLKTESWGIRRCWRE
jgi:hypothetical protein